MNLKSILYRQEQEEIIEKIINILQLDDNNSISLYYLDNDIEKQSKIYLPVLFKIVPIFLIICVKIVKI